LLIVPILLLKTRPFFLFLLVITKTLSTFLLFSYLNMSMNFIQPKVKSQKPPSESLWTLWL
jgi:hypothetical protein